MLRHPTCLAPMRLCRCLPQVPTTSPLACASGYRAVPPGSCRLLLATQQLSPGYSKLISASPGTHREILCWPHTCRSSLPGLYTARATFSPSLHRSSGIIAMPSRRHQLQVLPATFAALPSAAGEERRPSQRAHDLATTLFPTHSRLYGLTLPPPFDRTRPRGMLL